MTEAGSGKDPSGEEGAERISMFQLGRMLQNELGPEARADLEARIAARDPGGAYLQSLADQAPERGWDSLRARIEAESARSPWARFLAWLRGAGAALVPRWPRYAFAFAVVCLCAVLGTYTFRARNPSVMGAVAMKGGSEAEFRLAVNGSACVACDHAPARSGDTLTILYRAADRIFVQTWYRDDAGPYLPYGGAGGDAKPWDGTLRWTEGPGRIVLSGGWKDEDVFIVSGREPFTAAEARSLLESGNGRAGLHAHVFRLRAP